MSFNKNKYQASDYNSKKSVVRNNPKTYTSITGEELDKAMKSVSFFWRKFVPGPLPWTSSLLDIEKSKKITSAGLNFYSWQKPMPKLILGLAKLSLLNPKPKPNSSKLHLRLCTAQVRLYKFILEIMEWIKYCDFHKLIDFINVEQQVAPSMYNHSN